MIGWLGLVCALAITGVMAGTRSLMALVEVEFTGHADQTTTVVLTNRGLRDEASKRWHREGWQLSFDNLDRVLAE